MKKVEKFEDLIAWQRARELTKNIYQITNTGDFARDYGLREQIRRASVSVMSNLAEGFDRGGRAEFHQFLVIAKASCAEIRSQLFVARDVEYIDQESFNGLYSLTQDTGKIINGLRAAVSRQKEER